MRSVIIANGVLNHISDARKSLRPDDLLIAADGGMRHCHALGVMPHVVIGDLDSLDPAEADTLKAVDVEVIQHPTRKDQTDLELALVLAAKRGATEIIVLGALGARWDMTMANILLPAASALAGITIRLIDGQQEIMLLRGGEEISFHGKRNDILSLIPLGQDAIGVTLRGLEYPMENGVLRFGDTRGISNALTKETAIVYLKQGLLLCTHIRMHDDRYP